MSMNAVTNWAYHHDLKPLHRLCGAQHNLSSSKRTIWSRGCQQRPRILSWEPLAVSKRSHSGNGIPNGRAGVNRVSLAGGVFPSTSISWNGGTIAGVTAAAIGALLFMTTASQRDPHRAMLATRQGMHLFAEGDVKGSLKKFDEVLELDARQLPYLWQRGLSLYYADRGWKDKDGKTQEAAWFEEGAKQFKEDVAVNRNDTEESIWCFLCEAQLYGVDEARRRFLDVGSDSRPIMAKIYNLFRYGGSVDTLLQGVDRNDGADFFYATLYVGLYHEAHKESEAARAAILAAIRSRYGSRSNDYMAALARVHAECRGWLAPS